jgi:hypothetical protein
VPSVSSLGLGKPAFDPRHHDSASYRLHATDNISKHQPSVPMTDDINPGTTYFSARTMRSCWQTPRCSTGYDLDHRRQPIVDPR